MRKSIFTILIALSLSVAAAEDLSVNKTMNDIGKVMVEFYPVIVTEGELSAKQNAKIGESLDKLHNLFTQVGPAIQKRPGAYTISYRFMLEFLRETQQAYKERRTDYVRSRLFSLGSLCTSCHTQDTHLRTLFKGAARDQLPDDFAYAEFNYMTRNYDEAEKYYERYLNSKTAKTEFDLIRPLQRLITIYTQIRNKPSDGAKQLQQFANAMGHSDVTRRALKGWISGLEGLNEQGAETIVKPDFAQIQGYVRKYLGPLDEPLSEVYVKPETEISRVWLRGLLYHYLTSDPPAEQIPQLLYWLALCDRSIEYDFYFSLADLYLKECVTQYGAHPYAQRCFAEYKEYLEYSYSGSAGTFLPQEAVDELHALETKLKKAKK